MIQNDLLLKLLKEQEEAAAKNYAHLYQRDAISYEDFLHLIEENKSSYNYLRLEIKNK